jgi:oxygen-independent coproporphyrinogen-3 oxidase
MYEEAIERLGNAGLAQYEISNFSQSGFASRHNLRYWERRPYLGLGLDASSMLQVPDSRSASTRDFRERGYVLRSTTTDGLAGFLAGPQPVETAWLSPASQHEEAWFLGLRLNAGVDVNALEQQFDGPIVAAALQVLPRLEAAGLISRTGKAVRLTSLGRLLSNDVFQEFLGLTPTSELARPRLGQLS